MPRGDAQNALQGFQLWANLPAASKMMEPRYRGIASDEIPLVTDAKGVTIRIIAGSVEGAVGPVRDVVTDPGYLDVTVPPGRSFTHPTRRGHTVFAYVIGGAGVFSGSEGAISDGHLVRFEDGDAVSVAADAELVRFLLISGKPIGEPIAWRGPIVMNTEQELRIAFEELERNTFIKHRGG
jgi:hypothetical protein